MPITQNLLYSGNDEDAGNTSVTDSFTTVSGRVTVAVFSAHPAGANANPSFSDSAGRTWTKDATHGHLSYDGATSGNGITCVYTTNAGTGTLTANYGASQLEVIKSVSEFPSADAVVQILSASGTGLTPAVTLSAFGSTDNGVFATASEPGPRTWTAGTGYTEITDNQGVGGIDSNMTQWRADNDTSVDCTMSGTGTPPWGIIALELRFAASGQTSSPTSDITSGWTPSTGATLFGTIDEVTADDADYDYTSTAATMEVKFAALTDPSTAYEHQVKYRIAGASTGNLVVSLRQGSSQIASWTHTPPSAITTYTGTLTSAEADSITDYTDLRLRVVSTT